MKLAIADLKRYQESVKARIKQMGATEALKWTVNCVIQKSKIRSGTNLL